MAATTQQKALKGGEFLIRETAANDIFIPEEFSEEQQMMVQACRDFVEKEIAPNIDRMESMEEGFLPSLLEKAGELGLLGISVPEAYGGMGMDFNTSMLIADVLGDTGSFSTAYGAHTGIGTLPILYYGIEAQKQKYLPKLTSGEWKGAYCLTEPDAGSDANAGKTKAVLAEDGKHYLITGQKMWISNGGFADVLIVFAKIEDDKNLTAFIVERDFGGITMNDEEKKMGIKGSSTRQIFFNECPVPIENMLSERGNGFKIAVNILNIGRIKLAAAVIGGGKSVITLSTQYANERKQFGQPISNFGAIKQKLARMATYIFATESACYRTGQAIDNCIESLQEEGLSDAAAKLKGVEQFAIECAMMKVFGSEALDYVVDEGVQIYGGMGYSAEAPMERAYRDSRIARIYEGTNEINRMLLVGMAIKRAMKGELDLMSAAMAVGKELTTVPDFGNEDLSAPFAKEKNVLKNLKKATLMVAGKAAQQFGPQLNNEQEILMNIADMMTYVYTAETTLLRAEKLLSLKGEDFSKQHINMAQAFLYDAVEKVNVCGREAVASFASGEEQKMMLMGLKRFTKNELVNIKALRRQIADAMIEHNKYTF